MIGINRLCTIHYRSLPKGTKCSNFTLFFDVIFHRHFTPFKLGTLWLTWTKVICPRVFVGIIWVEIPKIGGKTPKWMVKIMENPVFHGWFGGTPIFGNIHILLLTPHQYPKIESKKAGLLWNFWVKFVQNKTAMTESVSCAWVKMRSASQAGFLWYLISCKPQGDLINAYKCWQTKPCNWLHQAKSTRAARALKWYHSPKKNAA